MSYQALYRKFRPSNFSDVKGQDEIVQTLRNQIKADRIGHAYLFTGTRGTGKTSIAKIMAKAVNCLEPIDGEPCGNCAMCKAIANGNSLNVIEIDAASNNGVDSIRQINEEVRYSPTEGRFKVYIIDEAHMITPAAFNAMLKTLEEPPAYVIFILATTEAHRIPITILSRCQRYDFKRISIETIASRLSKIVEAEGNHVEPRAIQYIAKLGDGSMRDALSLMDRCLSFYIDKELKYENVLDLLGAVDAEVYAEFFNVLVSSDVAECMRLIENIVIQGRDLGQFVTELIWYIRNLLIIKTANEDENIDSLIEISSENFKEMSIQVGRVDAETLMRFIRILSELSNNLKNSTQKRVTLEIAMVRLMRPAMENKKNTAELVARINQLEKALDAVNEKISKGYTAKIDMGANRSEIKVKEPLKNQPTVKFATGGPEEVRFIIDNWLSLIDVEGSKGANPGIDSVVFRTSKINNETGEVTGPELVAAQSEDKLGIVFEKKLGGLLSAVDNGELLEYLKDKMDAFFTMNGKEAVEIPMQIVDVDGPLEENKFCAKYNVYEIVDKKLDEIAEKGIEFDNNAQEKEDGDLLSMIGEE